MDTTTHIAGRLRRTIHGPMWHGPALAEALAGFTATEAAAHPIPGAHCAWELVLHLTAWTEIVLERLDGEAADAATPGEDWPPVPREADDEAWVEAQARLAGAYEVLSDRVLRLRPAELDAPAPGQTYTVATMLDGVVAHGAYHGGQLAMLRRANAARAAGTRVGGSDSALTTP